MVHQVNKKKHQGVFIDALILTIVMILLGFSWGFYIEFSRTNKVIENYRNFEIEALDLKLQNYYYQIMDETTCKEAIEQNFIFADDLYESGLEIERYEEASQITEDIKREKNRYVLLKTELWLNTILLKEKCNAKFDTIVYLYENDPKNNAKVSEQKIISNVLENIKEEKGNQIILLPIAGNLDLNVVNLQTRIYGVNSLPSIIINEKTVLEGFHSEEDIKSYLKN